MDPITVVIADPDQVKRTACEYILRYEEGIQVVAQAATNKEMLAAVVKSQPRVLLCRFSLAAVDGFSLLQALRGEEPVPYVLLLTDRFIQEDLIMRALGMGARGHVSFEGISGQLAKAVRAVSQGQVWEGRQILGHFLDQAARRCWV